MKSPPIKSRAFQRAEQQFREWLASLGHVPTVIAKYPSSVRHFLHYLESLNRFKITDITLKRINDYYFKVVRQREYLSPPDFLKPRSMNNHLYALRKFTSP